MSAAAQKCSRPRLPRALVFDLDGCVWSPEMYELWGSGGAPFKPMEDGDLQDRGGQKVRLMADVRSIMHELKTDEKWTGTKVAVASCCDEPGWADECIRKFAIGDGYHLKDLFGPCEIYKGSKSGHLRTIAQKTGVALEDMLFLDNEYENCQTVAKIGVTVLYMPDGVTRELFQEALEKFPAPGTILGPKKKYHW